MKNKKINNESELLNIEKERNKAIVLDFLHDFESGQIKYNKEGLAKIKEFIEILARKNPYANLFIDELKVVISNDSMPSTKDEYPKAQYVPAFKTLAVPSYYLYDIINNKYSLADLIVSIGHEMQHYAQHQSFGAIDNKKYNISEQAKEKILDIKKDFYSKKLTFSEYYDLLAVLKYKINSSYFEQFRGLSKEEQIKRCKELAYGDYLHKKHEENAREAGIAFSECVLGAIRTDPRLDNALKIFLDEQLTNVDKRKVAEEKNKKTQYKSFLDFDTEIKKITTDDLINIESKIDKALVSFNKYDHELQYRNSVDNVLTYLTEKIFEDKSEDYLLEQLDAFLQLDLTKSAKTILNIVSKRNLPKSDILNLKNKLRDLILKGDIDESYFDIDYTKIFSVNELADISKELLKGNRFTYALAFIKNTSNNLGLNANLKNNDEFVYSEKIIDDCLKSIEIYLYKLKNKSIGCMVEDYNSIENSFDLAFKSLTFGNGAGINSRFNKVQKKLDKMNNLLSELKDCEPLYEEAYREYYSKKERAYEEIRQVYGEKMYQKKLNYSKFLDYMFESWVNDDKKPQKPDNPESQRLLG